MFLLKQHLNTQRRLGTLCSQAVQQQIERGDATPTQLRQRRRHLLKALRKRLPQSVKHSPEKLLHSAVMVLALWGFGGLAMPGTAEAAATFEHVMLNGFSVSGHATPAFADIDNDGDLDAFVGGQGGLVYFYRNDGSASAANFVAADGVTVINPLASFNMGSNVSPAFADIDNDGDLDVFVGESSGTVKFYQNDGDASTPTFVAANGTSIINPLASFNFGSSASPTFADIDNDGDLDAFVGEQGGTVKFYQNDGVAGFIATGVYSNVTHANVLNPLATITMGAAAAPAFADIDNDGDLDVFVGDQSGTVKFYQNNGNVTLANFVAADGVNIINPLTTIGVGSRSTPTFTDIDNDGDLDIFVGAYSGTVRFYKNNGTVTTPDFIEFPINPLAAVYSDCDTVPTFADIDNDGDQDAFIGEGCIASVQFFRNDGTDVTPQFVAENGTTVINPLAMIATGTYMAPTFADIDDDGDLDAFVGASDGTVKFYQNDGDASTPSFVAADGVSVINPLGLFDVGGFASPAFADIDNDSDLDVFVGASDGSVKFYQNDGTPLAPSFVAADGTTAINPLAVFNVGNTAKPAFTDIDSDGDLDVFVGANDGTIKFYQNNGGVSAPSFVAVDGVTVINPLAGFSVSRCAAPVFVDIDKDGDMDVFVGMYTGSVSFFENLESSSGASSGGSGGGGGSPGIPLLASLAALLFGRRKSLSLRKAI